jgi:hypothetical protein
VFIDDYPSVRVDVNSLYRSAVGMYLLCYWMDTGPALVDIVLLQLVGAIHDNSDWANAKIFVICRAWVLTGTMCSNLAYHWLSFIQQRVSVVHNALSLITELLLTHVFSPACKCFPLPLSPSSRWCWLRYITTTGRKYLFTVCMLSRLSADINFIFPAVQLVNTLRHIVEWFKDWHLLVLVLRRW